MLKPGRVITKIEVGDGFDIVAEKRFQDELTYVFICVFTLTKFLKVENFNRRSILDYLS